MFFGLLLVALGVLFLLQNLGILDQATWGVIWPVLMIIIGLSMVLKRKKFM